jgi:cyanophycinase
MITFPARRLPRLLLLLAVALSTLAWPAARAAAAPAPPRTLLPIGSGYSADTLQRFAQAAAARAGASVDLLVLPITFGTSADSTSPSERRKNLDLAERRRGQLETACNVVRQPSQSCRAVLVPMLIRADAFDPANLALFTPEVDGMYILGGDQTVAMRVVANTPTEERMAALYAAGAVVGGNSAGAAVESLTMIAGYTGSNGPDNGFQQGSVDIWAPDGPGDVERGLSFGIATAVLDQHVLQRGRIGRLLNTAFTTGLLGVGADADTGAAIVNEAQITDVSGRSAAFVADLKTYGATGSFAGPTSSLRLRGAVTHVIPAGGFGYDLQQLRPTIGNQPLPPPNVAGRSFDGLRGPARSGPLLLGGGLAGDLGGAAARRFVALSGGPAARIVVLTLGYARPADGRAAARDHASALQSGVSAPVQWFALDDRADPQALAAAIGGATGIWLTAPDQSRVMGALAANSQARDTVLRRWANEGVALLADNAAAAALGARIAAEAPSPATIAELEEEAISDFRPGDVAIQPGLGVLPGIAVEPRLMPERRWGQLYNMVAGAGSPLGLGVDVGTAVEVTAARAAVVGASVAVALDGRAGSFGVGANGALSARYVLLDTFVDGDEITAAR